MVLLHSLCGHALVGVQFHFIAPASILSVRDSACVFRWVCMCISQGEPGILVGSRIPQLQQPPGGGDDILAAIAVIAFFRAQPETLY